MSLTNNQISTSISNEDYDNAFYAVDSNGSTKLNDTDEDDMFRSGGVNNIKFYWNYFRVWLSASTLRDAIQVVTGLGGVFIPNPAVKSACVIAGVASNHITKGIWFDYNPTYYNSITRGITKAGIQN